MLESTGFRLFLPVSTFFLLPSSPPQTCRASRASTLEDDVFCCLVCNTTLHRTPSCTEFSAALLRELKDVKNNFLTLCSTCADRGKSDWVIAKCNEQKTEDSIMQAVFTSQVKPIHEAVVALSESVKRSVPANSPEPKARRTHEQNQRPAQSEMLGIRIRCIPESTVADQRKKIESDLAEVKKVITFLGLQCTVTDTVENKTRTIIARVSQIWGNNLILLRLSQCSLCRPRVNSGTSCKRDWKLEKTKKTDRQRSQPKNFAHKRLQTTNTENKGGMTWMNVTTIMWVKPVSYDYLKTLSK